MSDIKKQQFTAAEVAGSLLGRAKDFTQKYLQSRSDGMEKASPENQNAAQMAEVKIPQPKAPEAQSKIIAKRPLMLKQFVEKCAMKKGSK